MRRLVAALTILLFFVTLAPTGRAAGATIVWDTDQLITDSVTVEAGDSLRIESGVNVTFDVAGGGVLPDTAPSLTVNGTLELNGTESRPVSFSGVGAVADIYYSPAAIEVNGYDSGQPRRFSNSSFTNLSITFQDSAAVFENCTFNRSEVLMGNSRLTVRDCLFRTASIAGMFNDFTSRLEVHNCTFDGSGREPYGMSGWSFAFPESAVGCNGWTSVENCTIFNYTDGVMIERRTARVSGCAIFGCEVGIFYGTGNPSDVYGSIDVRDCDIGDCGYACIFINGNGNVTNCSLHESLLGINAQNERVFVRNMSYFSEASWDFSGNRFFDNGWWDIRLDGQDADVADNSFPRNNGSLSEQARVIMSLPVRFDIVDPKGAAVPDCTLNLTDATGYSFNQSGLGAQLTPSFGCYIIDNDGNRTDLYPYAAYALSDEGRSPTVTVVSGTWNVTLVIPWNCDLFPANLTASPAHPVAGRYVAFRVEVENRGIHTLANVIVALRVDGVLLDSVNITALAANSSASPLFLDWKATKGQHAVEMVVDPANAVNEYNETNNDLTITLVVNPAPQGTPPDSGRSYIWAGAGVIALAAIAAILARTRRKSGG